MSTYNALTAENKSTAAKCELATTAAEIGDNVGASTLASFGVRTWCDGICDNGGVFQRSLRCWVYILKHTR